MLNNRNQLYRLKRPQQGEFRSSLEMEKNHSAGPVYGCGIGRMKTNSENTWASESWRAWKLL